MCSNLCDDVSDRVSLAIRKVRIPRDCSGHTSDVKDKFEAKQNHGSGNYDINTIPDIQTNRPDPCDMGWHTGSDRVVAELSSTPRGKLD